MRPRGKALLAVIVLSAVALVTVWRTLPPSPLPAHAPATAFSAARAQRHIQALAARPRPSGSPAFAAARDYVRSELQALGLETETQRDGELRNTLGWIRGYGSAATVLLTAHLDSTADSPGASDDASGVAVLLETARALQAGAPLRNTLLFLFTDAEECGMLGAQAFIAHHPGAATVEVVIGLDAGGVRGPGVLSATSARNGWLVRQMVRADAYIVDSSAISALADSRTDFGRAFRAAGFAGYAWDYYWDKRDGPEDNLATLSLSSVQHQGYHALSLARHLGGLDLLADPQEPDAVYFGVLRLFTVRYTVGWAVPLALAVLCVLGLVVAYGLRRERLSWAGMGYGAGVMLAGVLVAPLPGLLLELPWGVPGLTAAYDHRLVDQPLPMGGIVLAALVLVSLGQRGTRRLVRSRARDLDLALGALLPFAVGMLGTSLAFPALSYALTWPLLGSLLALAHGMRGRARAHDPRPMVLGILLSGGASIIIVGPAILLGLFDQLTLSLAALGALCGLLIPQFHLALSGFPNTREPRG